MNEIIDKNKFTESIATGKIKINQNYLSYGEFLSKCYDNNINININNIDDLNFKLLIDYKDNIKYIIQELLLNEIIYYGYYPILFKTYKNDLILEYKLLSDIYFSINNPFYKIEISFSAEYKIDQNNYNKINSNRYLYTYQSKDLFQKIFKTSTIESDQLIVFENINDIKNINTDKFDIYKIDTKNLNIILHKKSNTPGFIIYNKIKNFKLIKPTFI